MRPDRQLQQTMGLAGRAMPRREALRRLGLLACALASGCTPLRMLLHAYPDSCGVGAGAPEHVLAAFVTTVIPGAEGRPESLARPFRDRALPFASHADYFAWDLCERGRRRFGARSFDRLTVEEREWVLRDGLAADRVTRRLYRGAITLSQVAVYAGIYDDGAGCALIGFDGANTGYPSATITYANAAAFLPAGRTCDGNPH